MKGKTEGEKARAPFRVPVDDNLLEILQQQEPQANRVIGLVISGCALVYVACWAVIMLGIFRTNRLLVSAVLLGGAAACGFSAWFCWRTKGEHHALRHLMLGVLLLYTFAMNLCLGYKYNLYYAFPIVLSSRYFRTRTVRNTSFIAAGLIFISCFTNVYFSRVTGVPDLNTVVFTNPVTMHVSGTLFEAVLDQEINTFRNLEITMLFTTLPNMMIVGAVGISCYFIVMHNQKLLVQVSDSQKEIAKVELERKELEVERAELEAREADSRNRVMVSQIGPHFLYNALSAIMAIDGNPDETVDAIGNFAKYLRENLDVLVSEEMTTFSKELQHVRRYLALEKLRFGDRVNVRYDIQTDRFLIPPLTVQMLTENAVKHGLQAKETGGTVTIRTGELDGEYIVIVSDDGVGFVPEDVDGREHVGLANVRFRLQHYCGGTLELRSEPGTGTTATVHIPKTGAAAEPAGSLPC